MQATARNILTSLPQLVSMPASPHQSTCSRIKSLRETPRSAPVDLGADLDRCCWWTLAGCQSHAGELEHEDELENEMFTIPMK
jgi:hypothetical protein